MTTKHTYIAWHCRGCGHKEETDQRYLYNPVNCPKCGSRDTRKGHPILPTNHVDRDERPNNYHFGSDKKTIQVYLRSMDGKSTGVCLDEDDVPDCSDFPERVAEELLRIVESKFLYYGGKGKLIAVIESMKSCEAQSDANRRLNRIEELRADIVSNLYELESVLDEQESYSLNAGSTGNQGITL